MRLARPRPTDDKPYRHGSLKFTRCSGVAACVVAVVAGALCVVVGTPAAACAKGWQRDERADDEHHQTKRQFCENPISRPIVAYYPTRRAWPWSPFTRNSTTTAAMNVPAQMPKIVPMIRKRIERKIALQMTADDRARRMPAYCRAAFFAPALPRQIRPARRVLRGRPSSRCPANRRIAHRHPSENCDRRNHQHRPGSVSSVTHRPTIMTATITR